jgi:hypothetical protein
MQPVSVTCPNPRCNLVLSVPGHRRGHQVRCVGCGQVFLTPPPEPARNRLPARSKG